MTISKNNKTYTVNELKSAWKLSITICGGLSVDYIVDKGIAATFAELGQYVAQSNTF